MTQNDFIFSNQFNHRLARHIAFFLACYLFFLLVYYVPYAVFPAWNTSEFVKVSARHGFPTWLKWRIVHSLIIFLPNLLFGYAVIYFALPRYYFNRKNVFITTALFVGIIIVISLLHYLGQMFLGWNNHRLNPAGSVSSTKASIDIMIKTTLFNFPIMAGFAVIIKMMKRSWLKQQETLLVVREKAKAELQLLKAQVHPHFLFNTLNNIYSNTQNTSPVASRMITELSDILRFILYECNMPLVALSKEIKMVGDYINLEQIRYGNNIDIHIETPENTNGLYIAPLLLLPLVENCFKHGTSNMIDQPWISLHLSIENNYLNTKLVNGKAKENRTDKQSAGIGLENVRKRLALIYPEKHNLTITNDEEVFIVSLKLQLDNIAEKNLSIRNKPEVSHA